MVKRKIKTRAKQTRSKKQTKQESTIKSQSFQLKLCYVLLVITIILSLATIAKAQGFFIPDLTEEFVIIDNTIYLDQLSLEEKIGQMVVAHGSTYNIESWRKMNIGAFHLFAMESEESYKTTIDSFQERMAIPFFVTTDLEGCQNSFANFRDFTPNDQITTIEQATAKGLEEGEFLQELGFSINFAPVVDLKDTIWGCRSFLGDAEDVTNLSNAYITALQSYGVSATLKHYPGKTLEVSDPHQNLVSATIDDLDLLPYEKLIQIEGQDMVDLIMVSHIIVDGKVNSFGLPSSVSTDVMHPLKESYEGLIISDDILMLGLQDYYEGNTDQLAIDLVLAGHDLIINFNDDPNEIYHMIQVIKNAVEDGTIEETQIDTSVTKILKVKGFVIK